MVDVQPSARTLELRLDGGQTKEHTEEQTFLYIHRKHFAHWSSYLVSFCYTFSV